VRLTPTTNTKGTLWKDLKNDLRVVVDLRPAASRRTCRLIRRGWGRAVLSS
jgi:hypothetical protein